MGGDVELRKLPNALELVMAVLIMVVLLSNEATDSVDILLLLLILLSDELRFGTTTELVLLLKDITSEDTATKEGEGDGNTINEDIADDTASSPLPKPLPTLWASLIPTKQRKIHKVHKESYSILSESGKC